VSVESVPTVLEQEVEAIFEGEPGFPNDLHEVVARHRMGPLNEHSRNDFFRLQASIRRRFRPRHIITADSLYPKEIDDGVFVEALPTATEMYRVGVCLPNTAKLYLKHDILRPAIAQLHADYRIGPDGVDYTPLIDEEHIRDHEMKQGNRRHAMVLRFIVGQNHPPSDPTISFENVYVDRNLDYTKFSEQTQPSGQYERYARAGYYILEQLRYTDTEDNDAIVQADTLEMVRYLRDQQPDRLHVAGPQLTAAYMVASNHLGGLILDDANRVGIRRIFDPDNPIPHDFLPANMARFSLTPGRHAGLGLSTVLQISSPLRRIQDGLNGVQLWKLSKGMRQDQGDLRVLEETTHLLNLEIMMKYKRRLMRRYRPAASPEYIERAAQEQAIEDIHAVEY
jgi:hypothetical protein